MREARIRLDTEEQCLAFLRNIKNEGGKVYYYMEAKRLVINPRRKSYSFIAGLQHHTLYPFSPMRVQAAAILGPPQHRHSHQSRFRKHNRQRV
jgi:hypothetical protein